MRRQSDGSLAAIQSQCVLRANRVGREWISSVFGQTKAPDQRNVNMFALYEMCRLTTQLPVSQSLTAMGRQSICPK